MVLTSLELKDKTFGTKFRGYDADEVDDFLDIVTRDYEELIRKNHEQELELKSLRERLAYFDEMKESYLYKKVKYAPSVIIIKKGKIIAYLDADKNADLDKYQNEKVFEKWIKNYIYLK